jgi:predicted esterase
MRLPTRLPTLLLSIVVPLAAVPAQKRGEVPKVAPSTKAERGVVLEWTSKQGRPYWYRLPDTIGEQNPPNLLLMLHGTGLDQGWSFWNYPIVGDFRKDDIVVSPDGLTPGGETFNFVQGPKDGDQIAQLIADFQQAFPIGRVYLYGHSQGAFFCYWFAGEYPALIDGIVAHAGNVLQVTHGTLAKQKVAIGILHGRADAVVPVECAVRTAAIYREQGYEKVKLDIVEGLTEQSGHWPLPFHVDQMLAWLDNVSVQTAGQAVRGAASELGREQPELTVVADQLGRAQKLMRKAGAADKKVLQPQLDALQAFLERAAAMHAEQLLAEPAVSDPKAGYGAWVPHFVAADRAFGELANWKKLMAKPCALAGRHDKLVDKALKAIEKGSKGSTAAGIETFTEAFLSARADHLRTALIGAFASAKEPVGQSQFDALVRQRGEDAEAARKAAAELTAPLLAELRQALPELFAAAVR